MSVPHVLYIHGANSSPKSFSYVREALLPHTCDYFSYDASDKLADIIDRAIDQVDRPCHIIAHSLGGIVAANVAHAHPSLVKTVTTIATPYGGSEAANMLSLVMPFNQFLRNIRPSNSILVQTREQPVPVPTLCITAHGGNNPLISSANDGVVTVSSQTPPPGATKVSLECTHFEVLLDTVTVELISNFIAHIN